MGSSQLVDVRMCAGREGGRLRRSGLSGSVSSRCCGDLVALRVRAVRGDLLCGRSALRAGAVVNVCWMDSAPYAFAVSCCSSSGIRAGVLPVVMS